MIRNGYIALDSEYLSDVVRQTGREIDYNQRQLQHFGRISNHDSSGETQFFREIYNRAMCIHGSVPEGIVSVILPAQRYEQAATFCGKELAADTFATCLPRDPVALCTPDEYRYINFSVSTNRLDNALRILHQRGLDELIPHTALRSAPVRLVSRLRMAARATFTGNAAHAINAMSESHVIAALGTALTAGHPPLATRLATRNHWRCVRKVRDFVEAHLGEPLGIEMLCQAAMVSERTLTTAFREVLGVSPWQFIKARRLNAARHLLSANSGNDTSVKWVAGCLGFTHLGHFARDYRLHFGESPSVTLACSGSRKKGIRKSAVAEV